MPQTAENFSQHNVNGIASMQKRYARTLTPSHLVHGLRDFLVVGLQLETMAQSLVSFFTATGIQQGAPQVGIEVGVIRFFGCGFAAEIDTFLMSTGMKA
jgi:hypothetical protein